MNEVLLARHGYVWAGVRRVHYRIAGRGAPVVLLHASPVSGASLIDRIEAFAAHGALAVAIDTPGYGESDELDLDTPSLADYAEALASSLDALGLQRVVLYGRHTGAAIGAQFAALYPQRVALLYCDGYPIYDAATRQRYRQRYVTTHAHDFTGSHLVWAWNRYREQFVHWPWFEQNPTHRADIDLPAPAALHRGTLDLLAAGPRYGQAEAAVFGEDTGPLLAAVSTPSIVSAREGDSLLKRVPELSRHGTFDVRAVPRQVTAALEAEWQCIAPYLDDTSVRAVPSASAPPGRIDRGIVDVAGVSWCVRTQRPYGPNEASDADRPLVLVPDGPMSAQALEPWMARFRRDRLLWTADWPGAGNSAAIDAAPSHAEAAAQLLGLLDQQGLGSMDLCGWGVGAWIVREVQAQAPHRVRNLQALRPVDWRGTGLATRNWLPELVPVAEGSHLIRAWQYLRDSRLWSPWFDRRRGRHGAMTDGIDVAALDRELLALMQQPDRFAGFDCWYVQCLGKLPPATGHPEPPHGD